VAVPNCKPALRRVRKASKELAQQLVRNGEDFKQLAAGLRTLDAKRPRNSDLDRLNAGAAALNAGHADHGRPERLASGSRQMRDQLAADPNRGQ